MATDNINQFLGGTWLYNPSQSIITDNNILNRWALGVMLGVYVAGNSGGYLNPAITFANCVYRGLPWKRLPIYSGTLFWRLDSGRHRLRTLLLCY